ncbi:hypothetical protein LEN26_000897 [Aphanomyces euteiches]|nr:hypothetical protein AeMF1_010799 [Aphanomyces euteiches]KAH9162569.1 hypothetical protein LEN26_000897 [Aphanomyces euteiches]KAH9192439.1 hypothetical protein AeNC1_005593 [Aphanomyces euteiches]
MYAKSNSVTPRGSFLSTASPRASSSMNLDDVNIKTWILNTSVIDNVTYYRILVRRGTSNVIQETKHRYNEFLEFRDSLLELFETMPTCPRCINIAKAVASFDFPKKHYFSARSKVVINYRMHAFRNFVTMLVTKVFNPSPKCPTCGGKVITAVLRFLLQNATILPENQIPRDGLMQRSETPSSTRSTASSAGFQNFPRSVSAPLNSQRQAVPQQPPASAPTAATNGGPLPVQPAPQSKFSSLHRYSVPQEEQEDLYDDFDDDVEKVRRESRQQVMFDSFLHDKDSVKERGMSAVSDTIPDAPELEGDNTSESSDEEEIEMTGVFNAPQ